MTPDNEQPATPPEGDPPRSEPPVSDSSPLREPSAAAAAAESAEPPPADDAAASPAAEEPPRRAGFSGGALIGAAVLGAAIALAVGAAATAFFLPRDAVVGWGLAGLRRHDGGGRLPQRRRLRYHRLGPGWIAVGRRGRRVIVRGHGHSWIRGDPAGVRL